MGKYFGTDGVRGKANVTLNVEMALKIGKFIGNKYKNHGIGKILIGKDTRLSSSMFETALAAGISCGGCDAYLLGVCSTPAVAHIVKNERFACGIMISASHNPYYDNGIKLFNYEGKKMDESILDELENYIDDKITVELAKNDEIGEVIDWKEGRILYESWLQQNTLQDYSNMNIALDLANGSATASAVKVMHALRANLKVIHSTPNGVNINRECGSTHPESLQKLMREGNYDIGFAFDGDADRLICVDEKGNILDGDKYLFILAKYMKKHNLLNKNTVVTTVMANLGLYKAFEQQGINTIKTAVGDKYVFEEMEKENYSLGGEQSGHIIFKEYANTGDGLLSALKLLEVIKNENKPVSELAKEVIIYPQVLINVAVDDKEKIMTNPNVLAKAKEIETILGDDGRILVRESGTEPLVRVMVEAKTDELCQKYANMVVEVIKNS